MIHNVHLNELPPEGLYFEGEIRTDLFELKGQADPKFKGPVNYALTVTLDGPDIVVEGSLSALFDLECGGCGLWFPHLVDLPEYVYQEPREGASTLDLTVLIREDILLALPGYPRCEESNVESRSCPGKAKFAPESEYVQLTGAETDELKQSGVWEVLDRLSSDGQGGKKSN